MLKNLIYEIRYSKLHFFYLKYFKPKFFNRYMDFLKNEIKFYKKFLNDNDLVFDLGAHFGDKTNVFSRLSNKVISYEPETKLFRRLKKRFRNNKSIIIENKLISDKTTRGKHLETHPLILIGADLNQEALNVAKENLNRSKIDCNFLIADISKRTLGDYYLRAVF